MWRILLSIAGMLIAIAGVVWTLQGLGAIKGSVMTGQTLWATIGPLVALGGLVVIRAGLRRSAGQRARRRYAQPPPTPQPPARERCRGPGLTRRWSGGAA